MMSSSSKKTILIIANTMLFPARRNGVSVRYYPFVNELVKRGYNVDLVVINKFNEKYNDDTLRQAQNIYGSIEVINTNTIKPDIFRRLLVKTTNLLRLFSLTGIPHCLIDNNKQHYLTELTIRLEHKERYSHSIGIDVGGGNALLLNELPAKIKPQHIICDFVDSAYLLRKRSARTFLEHINPITLLEDWKTKRWETKISETLPSIYISKQDALTTGSNATVIPNCVANHDYSDATPTQLKHPSIGFIGSMAYPPNIEACNYIFDEIFPALLSKIPNLQLYIIGRYPSESLLKKNDRPNIHVTGGVDNIWCYIKSIDVFLFPMFSGAGLQNKVLEAMYAGKPVVCSTIANEGIDASHGRDLHIAESVPEYVKYTEKSLLNRDAIEMHAKKFIQEYFSLAMCVDNIEQTMKKSLPPAHSHSNI